MLWRFVISVFNYISVFLVLLYFIFIFLLYFISVNLYFIANKQILKVLVHYNNPDIIHNKYSVLPNNQYGNVLCTTYKSSRLIEHIINKLGDAILYYK